MIKNRSKMDFTPISKKDYIKLHLETNPDTSREELELGLEEVFRDFKTGVICDCGNRFRPGCISPKTVMRLNQQTPERLVAHSDQCGQ